MAGIYIHVPFCRKACNYCDFHFSTNTQSKADMLKCMVKEMHSRKDYLNGQKIETIYFGGGTPSLLTPSELKLLLDNVHSQFEVVAEVEITLEANPDDISKQQDNNYLSEIRALGINRLSIGVQSFFDEHLTWMNRAHDAEQAKTCVQEAKAAGFDNITIDLIYGIPNMSMEQWKSNIEAALALPVQHISAYCLTVEQNTALHKLVRDKKVHEVADEVIESQVNLLVEMLADKGFERYEISNFALTNCESKHNTSYWKGTHYLGIGPSAHSYNGISRSWSIDNNASYIKAITSAQDWLELEDIDETTAYNEYMMTRLRLAKGIDLNEVKRLFLVDIEKDFKQELEDVLEDKHGIIENGHLRLTHQGKFFADGIASDFFLSDDED